MSRARRRGGAPLGGEEGGRGQRKRRGKGVCVYLGRYMMLAWHRRHGQSVRGRSVPNDANIGKAEKDMQESRTLGRAA